MTGCIGSNRSSGRRDILLSLARRKGWREALHDYLNQTDRPLYEHIGTPNRADWRFLVSTSDMEWVLDLGCGWGTQAIALGESGAKVVALDTQNPSFMFFQARVSQSGCPNLFPIVASYADVPFRDGTFDLILLDEGISAGPDSETPLLARLSGLLTDTGILVLPVENRLHPFRWLRRRNSNGLKMRPLPAYVKALRAAGFGNVRPFLAIPHHRQPQFYVSANDKGAQTFLAGHIKKRTGRKKWKYALLSTVLRLSIACGCFKYLMSSYLLVAEKTG